MWFTESKLPGIAVLPRFLLGAPRRARRRWGVRGPRRARADPAALQAPHRAGASSTVGLGLATTRARRRDLGQTTHGRLPPRPGSARRRRSSARTSRTTAGSLIIARHRGADRVERLPEAHGATGLIIRAGVENPRDGHCTRHRRAPARSHSCSRSVAWRLRSPACSSGVLLSARSTRHGGTSLLIFAFIVVVIGGLGSLRGTAGWQQLSSVSCSSMRITTPFVGTRRLERRAPARPRAPRPARRLVTELCVSPRCLQAVGRAHRPACRAGARAAVLDRHPVRVQRGRSTRLARCSCSRSASSSAASRWSYDLLFRLTPACSRSGTRSTFAVGVYITAIAITKWHWSFVGAIAFTALVGVLLPLVPGRCVAARRRDCVRDGHACVSRRRARSSSSRNPYGWTRRRGGPGRGLHETTGGAWSGSSTTKAPLLGSRSASSPSRS